MSGSIIALRYARALLDVAATRDLSVVIENDLQSVDELMSSAPEIRDFCVGGNHALSVELEFIDLAFCPYVHELTCRSLQIMVRNGRISTIPYLYAATMLLQRENAAVEAVVLETVKMADAALMHRVSERMERRLNKKIELTNRENPDILAGYRVLWRDRLLDNSALARVRAIGRHLATNLNE